MKELKKIIYFGQQVDIFDFIKRYYSKQSDIFRTFEVVQIKSFNELSGMIDESLSVLVMDFCENEDTGFFAMCLNALKKGFGGFTIPTMGIFKSKEQLVAYGNTWGMGVNYFFIKGSDMPQAFSSMSYICFEEESFCVNYAFVKGPKTQSRINAMGLISSFDQHSLTVDKDIRSSEDILEMKTNLFEDFTSTHFSSQEIYEKGFKFETLFSELLLIEYSSAWDEGENLMFEDTFSSWIEGNKESFISKKATVFVYTDQLKIIPELVKLLDQFPELDIHFRSEFESDQKEIQKYGPDLVLFSMDNDTSYERLEGLIEALDSDEKLSQSILYLFNHPSKAQALRKLFNRDTIISTNKEIDAAFLAQLLERLDRAKKAKKGRYQFDYLDARAKTLLPFDAKVTSLTENEITFTTNLEIPFYTLLFLEAPIPMFLVTIPSFRKLSVSSSENHYMAFICGLDFHEQEYVRRFVNRVRHEGLKSLDYIDFDSVSKAQAESIGHRPETNKEEPESTENGKTDKNNNKLISSGRRKTKGKVSKL